MKIRQLEVTGFKSFVDKTTVVFPEGICAVVGPNGCGKSNIVDALRWVMGEQSVKMLRGKAMEDVIFSGTEKRPSLNMAEVSITLVNDNGNTPEQYREFSEIMVARRLFRTGESGYFINKQPCRLKDVQDLLMGSGVGARTYAIIEQGRISSLIDAGPDERRFFVEEAAGTTRYKSRRNEALRKIERTHQNLLRVNDVVTEIKRQMNSLKRQARKAERYKKYQEEVERLDVHLASHQHKVICEKIQEAEDLLKSLRDTDLGHGSQLAKLDAAIEQIKQDRTAKHEEISEHKNTRYQLQRTIDKLEGDIQYGERDRGRLADEAEQLKIEIKEIEERDKEVALECLKLEERASTVQDEIDKTSETIKKEAPTEGGLKDRIEGLKQTLDRNKAELMTLATRKAAFDNTLQNTSQTKVSLARRLEQNDKEKKEATAQRAKLERRLSETTEALQVLRNRLADLTGSIESSNEQLVKKRAALGEQVRNVHTLESEKQQVKSRHAALKKMDENYEWYKEGVRSIMKTSKSKNPEETGIHGLVAEVIEVEPSYEDAVEVALGETLQYVIVSDQEGGVAAIDHLRTESAGRGGFIPMRGVKPVVKVDSDHIRSNLPDAHTLLLDHVTVRKGYEGLIQYLVGHVVISENLKAGLQLWNRNGMPHTVVTREGDRVCSQGILIGGSPDQEASGILTKKKEIRELGKKLSNLERAVTEAKSIQTSLETETVDLEIKIQKAKQSEQEMHQEEMDVDKELYRSGEELKHCEHRTKILDLEAEQIKGEETDLVGELSKYEEMLSELSREMETAESTITETSKEISEVSAIQESVNQKLVGLRLDLTRLEAQRDNVQSTLHRLSSFQDERLDKLNQLNRLLKQKGQDDIALGQKLEENRSRIARLYGELEAAEEVLSGMETQYQAIEKMLEENERSLSDIGGAQQEVSQKIQQLELKQTERRMRCEHLANRIQETYYRGLERVDDQNDAEALSVEEMEGALARYREQIARIGDVNLGAIEEYEALAERHQFLTEQRDDLMEAIEALRRVIRKINRKSLRQFMRTFKAVNEKLQQVFPSLFEGGAAKLVLTDPKRPLESGVSYLVHPPGKKLTRMSLLSGGEKALSSIALVFSLFLIKPTAFCVFDEIDAPLDDVNTNRFNGILKQIGRDSQVILVTHNKQTMEVADALFGVTMEHKGVSKLISINLEN